jgi:preprotein translocase subunit SecA
MTGFLHRLLERGLGTANPRPRQIDSIERQQVEFRKRGDAELRRAFESATEITAGIAAAAVAARRVLGLEMFPEQLQGALGLADGHIVEMQTGEGKTLAAVPAVAWLARLRRGVHVMTVNDYLARRDAAWMGGIYRMLGLSVGCIQQGLPYAERKTAYGCDITYATANEAGFDFLRDQVALRAEEQVHRPFHAALIDEADSILIDEARIPLVLAGGATSGENVAVKADRVGRLLQRGLHFQLDEFERNISLTDKGARAVENTLGCGNIWAEENYELYTALIDAIHAHNLLHRDVDYVVTEKGIESVDAFKGRIAPDRRWPAGLQTALEAKEHLAIQQQGRVLGSITLQNFVAHYEHLCGMTGTAATQAGEFRSIYGLEVEVIPTHRPVIRKDLADVMFGSRAEKEASVLEAIRERHATGQPVLVGTASVEESERLAGQLPDVPHAVLNARNEEEEAAIVAKAGQRGGVTISTNMAGRGVDIQLSDGVADLGGLHVIGTNRHESRRIDHQLRGRAGRQGDPGSSQFFVSAQDELMVRFGCRDVGEIEETQRRVEGQNLDIRLLLNRYEAVVEGQRRKTQERRQRILTGEESTGSELERVVALTTIDDLWSEYLASVADLKSDIVWTSLSFREPLYEYMKGVDTLFCAMEERLEPEIAERLERAQTEGIDPTQRGATWTYLTTDQPFGSATERVMKGLMRKFQKREMWG